MRKIGRSAKLDWAKGSILMQSISKLDNITVQIAVLYEAPLVFFLSTGNLLHLPC